MLRNVNIFNHLLGTIFRKYSHARITQRILRKIPIRIITPKLYWIFLKRFFIYFMLVDTKDIGLCRFKIWLYIVASHSGSNAINVPRGNSNLVGSLASSELPFTYAGFDLFIGTDLKMLRSKNFKVPSSVLAFFL